MEISHKELNTNTNEKKICEDERNVRNLIEKQENMRSNTVNSKT